MNLYYIVSTENCCSHIDSVIPSKYIGELSYKATSALRRNLFFYPSNNSTSNFKHDVAKSILISYNRFEYFSSKKYTSKLKCSYIYKDLKEHDLSILHLSINNPKIFTYNEDDAEVLNLIKEYSQSYYEIMDHIKNIEIYEASINPDSERINFHSNEINQELIGQKQNFPNILKSIEYTEQINKVMLNPKILKRSKKLINIYKNWFDSYIKLRFN
jgi:hypothetical protein